MLKFNLATYITCSPSFAPHKITTSGQIVFYPAVETFCKTCVEVDCAKTLRSETEFSHISASGNALGRFSWKYLSIIELNFHNSSQTSSQIIMLQIHGLVLDALAERISTEKRFREITLTPFTLHTYTLESHSVLWDIFHKVAESFFIENACERFENTCAWRRPDTNTARASAGEKLSRARIEKKFPDLVLLSRSTTTVSLLRLSQKHLWKKLILIVLLCEVSARSGWKFQSQLRKSSFDRVDDRVQKVRCESENFFSPIVKKKKMEISNWKFREKSFLRV